MFFESFVLAFVLGEEGKEILDSPFAERTCEMFHGLIYEVCAEDCGDDADRDICTRPMVVSGGDGDDGG